MSNDAKRLTREQIEDMQDRRHWTPLTPDQVNALCDMALAALRQQDGVVVPEDHSESLGRRVREVWILWAKEQPNPKESWLVPYDELSEADKEVDRRIGAALWGDGVASALRAQDGVVVPREPTGAMRLAGMKMPVGVLAEAIYKAMLAAAETTDNAGGQDSQPPTKADGKGAENATVMPVPPAPAELVRRLRRHEWGFAVRWLTNEAANRIESDARRIAELERERNEALESLGKQFGRAEKAERRNAELEKDIAQAEKNADSIAAVSVEWQERAEKDELLLRGHSCEYKVGRPGVGPCPICKYLEGIVG